MLGLAVDQPLEAIFFPRILDRFSWRLGLTPPGVVDPPTSARAGMSQRWAAALREAVMRNEGWDVNLEQVTPHVVHPGLHQDCKVLLLNQLMETCVCPVFLGYTALVLCISIIRDFWGML